MIVQRAYVSHGSIHITCECYGHSPKIDPLMPRQRLVPSKKCNCPYDCKVYCFDKPTKYRQGAQRSEYICFLPGVYFYEYPSRDHTCRYTLVKNVTDSFESEVLYNKLPQESQNFVGNHFSEKEFWEYAIILYRSDIPQDKAFEILQQIGNVSSAQKSNFILRTKSSNVLNH